MDLRAAAGPHHQLPAPHHQRLVLFDLDRTLIPGSSLVPFGRELLRCGLVTRRVLARHLVTATRFRHRGMTDEGIDTTRDTGTALPAPDRG